MARKNTPSATRSSWTGAEIAIVVSRYNASITDRLLDGAVSAYQARGGSPADLMIIDAPGAFEIPSLCDAAAATGRFSGILALGCIIKGETSHDQHLASAVAHGLVNISLLTGVPASLGVLTVNSVQQARDRAGGKHGNKGEEAMNALLLTIQQIQRLQNAGGAGSDDAEPNQVALPDKAATGRKSPGASRGSGGRR